MSFLSVPSTGMSARPESGENEEMIQSLKGAWRLLVVVCLVSFLAVAAAGQTFPEEKKVFPLDPQAGALFGYSSAVSGDTMVLGAFLADSNVFSSGAAYVFQRAHGRWTQIAKLTPNDAESNEWFGSSAAISGDTIIVGSPLSTVAGKSAGAAYVFRLVNNQWIQEAKLTASDPSDFALFGGDQGVAISGNTAIVGAPLAPNADPRTPFGTFGVAYVYQRTGSSWQQVARLTNPDPDTFGDFGVSVAVSGSGILVGADGSGAGDLAFSGAVYVFRSQNGVWAQEAKLVASDPEFGAGFGSSVSLSLDTAAIGAAFGTNDSAIPSGKAYIFRRNNGVWQQEARLVPADGQPFDLYGERLAIANGTVLIGSEFHPNAAGVQVGAGYVYSRVNGQWVQLYQMQPSDGMEFGEYGCSIATDGSDAGCGRRQTGRFRRSVLRRGIYLRFRLTSKQGEQDSKQPLMVAETISASHHGRHHISVRVLGLGDSQSG